MTNKLHFDKLDVDITLDLFRHDSDLSLYLFHGFALDNI